MNYTLKINPKAQEDLQEIKKYVELDDPIAASKLILKILDAIDNLKQFPQMGLLLQNKINIKTKYRYIIVKNYLVFYFVNYTNIFITRVLHATRDYKTIFNTNLLN